MARPDITQDSTERLHSTIQSLIDDPGEHNVLTKWVLVYETLDQDDEKHLSAIRGPTHNACPVWDVVGLLDYARDEIDFRDDEDDAD